MLNPGERFQTTNLRGDILGGLTTAVISLPLALAFGVASGAGPQAGLYGAVIVGLLAAIFGGTRTLISEPTGPMTVIMTAVVADLLASYPEDGLAMAFGVVIVAGVVQITFGALKLGRYVTLMPYSVISGFMSGIGVLLILMQLAPALGQATPPGGAIAIIEQLPDILAGVQWPELFLSVFAIALLFGFPAKWRRIIPPHLIVLFAGTLLSVVFFSGDSLRRIGEIPMGLPSLQLPPLSFSVLGRIIGDGVVLGLLGCIDTLLTAMIADSLTRKQHDSNRELIGQGIANCASGLFGGLPGAGATMGTVVNIQVGANSPISGVVRALSLLLVILVLAPLLQSIPLAVLSAIAIKVGVDILDWSFLKRAHKVSRTATMIMYGVLAMTVLVDLIVAVGIGVFIANILTIERLSNLQSSKVRTIDTSDSELQLPPDEKAIFDKARGRILLMHLSGPMIFGVAKAISREHTSLHGSRVLVLDLTDVPMMSTTVALALENMVVDARSENINVYVAAASGPARERLERLELRRHGSVQFCETRKDALHQAYATLEAG